MMCIEHLTQGVTGKYLMRINFAPWRKKKKKGSHWLRL